MPCGHALIIYFVPLTSYSHQPKWFDSSIRNHIKCLHTLRRKHSKHPTITLRSKIEELEKLS